MIVIWVTVEHLGEVFYAFTVVQMRLVECDVDAVRGYRAERLGVELIWILIVALCVIIMG